MIVGSAVPTIVASRAESASVSSRPATMVATIQPRGRSASAVVGAVELGERLVMEILLEEALALRKGEDGREGVNDHGEVSVVQFIQDGVQALLSHSLASQQHLACFGQAHDRPAAISRVIGSFGQVRLD